MNEREFLEQNEAAINHLLSQYPMLGVLWQKIRRERGDTRFDGLWTPLILGAWDQPASPEEIARVLLPHIEDVLWESGIKIVRLPSGDAEGCWTDSTAKGACHESRWEALSFALQHWYQQNKTRVIDTLPEGELLIDVDGMHFWRSGTIAYWRDSNGGHWFDKQIADALDAAKSVEILYPTQTGGAE